MANAAQVLQQAHDLIEAGDYQAARQILDAVRSSNENNPDFWWVYAHAVDDAAEGKTAIERVRQLAPNYAGLETFVGGGSPASTIKSLRPLAPPPPSLGKAEEDEFAETSAETGKKPNRFMPILAAMLLVLLIAGVLIVSLGGVFNNNGGNLTPQPTAIIDNFATQPIATSDSQSIATEASTEAVIATEEDATATEEIVVTEVETEISETEEPIVVTEAETEVVTNEAFVEVMDELADFGVPSDGIAEESSSLGQTLVVTTCATPGPAASRNIVGILNAFKDAGVNLEAEAVAFNITDCSDSSLIISLGVAGEIVQSYWLGDTTEAELLAALRRL